MINKELDSYLREFQISSIRYGKTVSEVIQIAIRVTRGNYTPKKPLKIIELILYEHNREQAEHHIVHLKEAIMEMMPDYAGYILERIKFEIRPLPKTKPKPLEWVLVEEYVDIFKESEEEPNE